MGSGSGGSATDFDGAWKEALDEYLEPFLRLCFPIVHAGIDWKHRALPLDKELQEIVRDAETGKHMPYITSIEKLGRQEGRQEGRREGWQKGHQAGRQEGLIAARQKAVLDALEFRLGPVPHALHQTVASIHDEARLRALLQTAIQTVSIEAFARAL